MNNRLHAALSAYEQTKDNTMKLSKQIMPYRLDIHGNEIMITSKSGATLCKYSKIHRLGDLKLSSLAHRREAIIRDEDGKIKTVFMYDRDDDTRGHSYKFRLTLLGNLTLKQIT